MVIKHTQYFTHANVQAMNEKDSQSPQHKKPSYREEETWEVIFTASGIPHSHIIRGRLESEGIPTRVKYESAIVVYPVTVNGLGKVDILVEKNHREKALQILSESYNEEEFPQENHE